MVKISGERGGYTGRTHDRIRAKDRAHAAGNLHEAYAHPVSLHVSYRILKGGKLLDPDVPLEQKHLKSVPQTADDAFERLHSEWNKEREKVDIPLLNWGLHAADATVQLLEHADYAKRDLMLALHGWGISLNGLATGERERIAAGFVGDFYRNYCGENVREGMANMARQLISTFVDVYGVEHDHTRYLVEKSVLVVLDSMKDWLTRFYGREDLQEAFAACVKAEMAVGAGRLNTMEKLGEVRAAPLGEEEKRVLRTIHKIPSPRPERVVPQRRGTTKAERRATDEVSRMGDGGEPQPVAGKRSHGLAADSDSQEGRIPVGVLASGRLDDGEIGKADTPPTTPMPAPGSIPAAFVDPEVLQHFGASAQRAERQALPTLEEMRRDIVALSIKRGKYYPTRAALLPLITELASNSKGSYDTQSDPVLQKVKSIVNIGDLALMLDLEAFLNPENGRIQDMSTLLDRVIADSAFPGGITQDFGLFTLDARREIRTIVATAAARLGADNTVLLLAQDERSKLSEDEARVIITEMTAAFGSTSQLQESSNVWVKNMLALPTFGDQLWYFITQVSPLESMYKTIRLERLREALKQAGKRSDEEEEIDVIEDVQPQEGNDDGIDTVITRRLPIVTASPWSAEVDRFGQFAPPPLSERVAVPANTSNWWEPEPKQESGDDDDWTR